eukprot:TRINITY_DN24565_c0_g1_i1.p1 TRINITY_DN24565_c0_g1~~TRINITY_DN24565_c0_g1_i1.p1  ORF type:complete len:736 (+),score=210.26 TRINITY_DN24565_c0_g1_i1:308-2209(+)
MALSDGSAEDGGATSGEGLSTTLSRAASLRSFGRSPTPEIASAYRKRRHDDLSMSATDSEAPLPHPAKKRRKGYAARRASPTSHFLRLPTEVLTPICTYCSLADVIALQQTCVALRRMTPPCLEVLDLSECTCNRYLSMLVMRLSMAGMAPRGISINAALNERYLGIIGFVLKSSPRLRMVEVKGAPSVEMVQALAEQCPNLKEYVQGGDGAVREVDPPPGMHVLPPGLQALSLILDGGKRHLVSVSLGQTIAPDLLKPPYTGVTHHALKRLRLDGLASGSFHGTKCCLPALCTLSVFEGPVCARSLPIGVQDVLNIVWESPLLHDLTVAASFQWSADEVRVLSERCPAVERLRLKSGGRGTEQWYAGSPTEQMSGTVYDAFLTTFPLVEMHVEAAGWDPHWTAYHDIVNTDSLVLQTQLSVLEDPLAHHLQHHGTFKQLQCVVLYGDVSNFLVHSVLRWCSGLQRLEVYMLPPSTADDSILRLDDRALVKPSLTFLHIHDATQGVGLGQTLTADVVRGMGTQFPNLSRLGLVGLPTEAVLQRLALHELPDGQLPSLTSFTVGPFLKTTANLLLLLKAAPGLRQLNLAWNGGQLPLGDEEFPAIGLRTLTAVAQLINPELSIADVQGHFNILF